MLGETQKGRLEVDRDADLCVLDQDEDGSLVLRQVWKFGVCVHAA
jgi:imidazolonepropionase-like amidohydrolase